MREGEVREEEALAIDRQTADGHLLDGVHNVVELIVAGKPINRRIVDPCLEFAIFEEGFVEHQVIEIEFRREVFAKPIFGDAYRK